MDDAAIWIERGLTLVGLLTTVYGAGKGGAAARKWYRSRHEQRLERLRAKRRRARQDADTDPDRTLP